jgi:hypothetical protein
MMFSIGHKLCVLKVHINLGDYSDLLRGKIKLPEFARRSFVHLASLATIERRFFGLEKIFPSIFHDSRASW